MSEENKAKDKYKKYLVVPGFVYSANDEDRHFISAFRLMHLYGVPKNLCIVITEERWIREGHAAKYQGLEVLRPKHHGNYRLGLT